MSASLPAQAAFWQTSQLHIATSTAQAEAAKTLEAFAISREDTRSLVFFQTSGSEGIPKWVGLSRQALLASASSVNEHLEATSKDRWLITLPQHHVGGFSIFARSYLSEARVFEFTGKWDADRFVQAVESGQITLTSLVPTQVYDLVRAKLQGPSSLRAVVVGGGAVSYDMGMKAIELGWPLLQSYGMTEAASQIATEPLDHLYAGFDPECLRVLTGWDLSTDDEDRLTLKGPALALGYALQSAQGWTWQPIDQEAGLLSRDRVRLWQHGTRQSLNFLGRESSYVKVLGELVNLVSLQKRLDLCLAKFRENAGKQIIWPLPDARKETRLVLVGECSKTELEVLRLIFNSRSEGYERLDAVFSLPALPRTAVGKIDRVAMEQLMNEFIPGQMLC
jgi:o-succinylbenzoate---CoA ligase